jgi:hypothetical protein
MSTGVTVGTSGGSKALTAASVGTASGAKAVTEIYVGTVSGARLVWTSMEVTAGNVSGARTGVGFVASSAATATVTGGAGPFTYLWEQVNGDAFTITSPTAASTTFSDSFGPADVPGARAGDYRCTVTDTATGYTATATITVSLSAS